LQRIESLGRAEAVRAIFQFRSCFVLLLMTHDAFPPSIDSVSMELPRGSSTFPRYRALSRAMHPRAQCERRFFPATHYAIGVPLLARFSDRAATRSVRMRCDN
jgi:hypothetical protein